MNYNPECEPDYEGLDNKILASIQNTTYQSQPKNTKNRIGNTNEGLLFDYGSLCSILTSH